MTSETNPARVFLSLGSNIEPEKNLPAAVRELERFGSVLRVSQVWQTAPVGWTDQSDFLNAAVLLETNLTAQQFRAVAIAAIESRLGRVRDPDNKNAPRTIDIDIALYNDDIIESEGRKIPDPDILTRPFVAATLAELDPERVHPETGESLRRIATKLQASAPAMTLRSDVQLAPK
ncbi:MAG: 2-amino-4-hydroxy-6-hydroxymethyldihydropteridine diphosphokinase [Planctomycetaceae bacterium]